MKFTEKLKDFKVRLSDRHMFSIVISVILIVAAVAVVQYKRAVDYRYSLENQYNRAFNELVDALGNIENNLAKGVVASDEAEMIKLANKIYSQSSFAMATLGQLPIADSALAGTSKFLAQVGDYTYSLSLKYLESGEITDEEYDTLLSFNRYAADLNASLLQMQADLYSGAITFNELENKGTALFSSQSEAFASSLEQMEAHFEDYPTLIYDGPYSDHMYNAEPSMLSGGSEVSLEQAQQRALEVVSEDKRGRIEYSGENLGTVPSYCFSIFPDGQKERSITVEITKVNALLSWMLDNRSVAEAVISADEAKAAAKEYLAAHAFPEMKESYYEIANNVITVNFAAISGDIILYPDLVKVKVAMDTGEIIGLEARGFIMNHTARQTPAFAYSDGEVMAKVSPKVYVTAINKCLIPTEAGGEVFCYEVKCGFDEKEFLIYLNEATLKQENILMLIVNENGSLTI